jgi:hypothetical protein
MGIVVLVILAALALASVVLHGNGVLTFRQQAGLLIDLTLLPGLFGISIAINAAAMAAAAPGKLGIKLYKTPGLWWMAKSAVTYKLMLAHFWSAVLMVFVAIAWAWLVKVLLSPEPRYMSLGDWLAFPVDMAGRKEWILRQAALGMLVGDCVFFFMGIATESSLFIALVLTVIYGSVIVFAALLHVSLWYHK